MTAELTDFPVIAKPFLAALLSGIQSDLVRVGSIVGRLPPGSQTTHARLQTALASARTNLAQACDPGVLTEDSALHALRHALAAFTAMAEVVHLASARYPIASKSLTRRLSSHILAAAEALASTQPEVVR